MNCIYLIENLVNHKKYIGKTNNIKRRNKQHRQDSFNPLTKEYNTHLSRAIRKYGWENFSVSIVEDNISDEKIGEKERYYISLYNTFEMGYNLTLGGEGGHGPTGSQFDIDGIKDKLKNSSLSLTKIAELFGCSPATVSDINNGRYHKDNNLEYPIRKDFRISLRESTQEIIDLLQYTNYSMNSIARYIGCSKDVIQKINQGQQEYLKDYQVDFPIRKTKKGITQKPVETNWRELM